MMLLEPTLRRRSAEILHERLARLYAQTDRLFAVLLLIQWLAAMILAVWVTPQTWIGSQSNLHIHVWAAVLLGGVLTGGPVAMVIVRPGTLGTRLTISMAQAGYSALLIHLTGGRIETHFHVFGSLAFLSFYRDWRVLVPATAVVTLDHMVRGIWWPESVFGVWSPSAWRALEHSAWVLFEDIFLAWSCLNSMRDLRQAADAQAELEYAKTATDRIVDRRTAELKDRTTELERSVAEAQRTAARLTQAQQLEAIGQVATGVAMEINAPLQLIEQHAHNLREGLDKLLALAAACADILEGESASSAPHNRQVAELLQELNQRQLQAELPATLEETLEGVQRVVAIVQAMNDFAKSGAGQVAPTDLNHVVSNTATVSRNRWRHVAELCLQLDRNLPSIPAWQADLNRVVLNLIVNAADAISERQRDHQAEPGLITVRTYADGKYAVIEVEDNGAGIPESVQARIFDPFFTTKDAHLGTGQGLVMAREIVESQHRGQLQFTSTPGEGSTFTIRLPLAPTPAWQPTGAAPQEPSFSIRP